MSKVQLLAIVVLCLMNTLSFADDRKVEHKKLVRAEAFELVDHNGKVRGGLKVGRDNSPEFYLNSASGNEFLQIFEFNGHARIVVRDIAGKKKVIISVNSTNYPEIALFSANGKRALSLTMKDNEPLLQLHDKKTNNPVATLGIENRSPLLSFNNELGRGHLMVKNDIMTGPIVELNGPEGTKREVSLYNNMTNAGLNISHNNGWHAFLVNCTNAGDIWAAISDGDKKKWWTFKMNPSGEELAYRKAKSTTPVVMWPK